ncbi:hypothetical protein [Stenotrophomonas sp. YIM B06876]|uniref:hypothetical protein n=1 Tax=Stenotrophomonas sp. YIM B06876 TaxID=3060211 RepID=UPI0027393733|nr:hypothetical protein [Stenotrophomonas sp. YIM B06876]
MSPAQAQDKTAIDLDQVIVTGTRTPVAIDKVPGAVTLVSAEQVIGVIGRIEVINGPAAAEGIGGVINYLSKNPGVAGHETIVTTRYSTQFKDDSAQTKIGLTHAYKGEAADFLVSGVSIDRGISYDGNGRRVGLNTSGSLF